MKEYYELAKKYLKYQKHRTILTILGVALASGTLFMILTLFFSNFVNKRDQLRKDMNYEMVFLIEDDAVANEIASNDFVKSAYAGTYYDVNTNTNYERALFINLKNPYRIDYYFEKLQDDYGVKGYINEGLSAYYLQGDTGNDNYIIVLMFMFLSVIFAIIGVGIIRNSIQLNTLEQVKDYGILRCVGATYGQLKKIIFLMGFYQEMTGLLLGYVIGFVVSVVIGALVHIKVSLLLVPVLFVAIAFIGDLYFVMDENSKIVKKLTPVEAVRGNFVAQKTKIKRRRKSIFGLVFGVEGDYAYKSLKANKGRYYKSVFAFGLGIAFFIGVSVFSYSLKEMDRAFNESYGEYPLYFLFAHNIEDSPDEIKSKLPSYDKLKQIVEADEISEAKAIYLANLNAVEPEAFIDKVNDDFLAETYWEEVYDDKKLNNPEYARLVSNLTLIGYDEEEYAGFKDSLVDGTLDVGEDGIVMVQQCKAYPIYSDEEDVISLEDAYGRWYVCNDYKVGDKIKLFDLARTREIYNNLLIEYGLDRELQITYDENGQVQYDTEEDKNRAKLRQECIQKAYEQALEEGAYREYTVEGIVKRDLTMTDNQPMQAIVPLNNFCEITGTSKEQSTGIKFSLKKNTLSSKLNGILYECEMEYPECYQSMYFYEVEAVNATRKVMRYISMFILFVVTMSSVNIVNTSASNLHLRRQELAQLRVIGVSKKRLSYIVLLEGIITAISANVLGNLLGYGFIVPLRKAVNVVFKIPLQGTLTASILGLVVSTLILCGSLYIPITKKGNSVVEDLNASGD